MKTFKNLLFIIFLSSFISCDLIKPIEFTNDDFQELIDNQLNKHFEGYEDLDVVRVSINSNGALKNTAGSVSILYKEGSEFDGKVLYLDNTGRNIDMKIYAPLEKIEERIPKKYKAFDFSKIPDNINKAIELIEVDYPDMKFESVANYNLYAGLKDGTQYDRFKVQIVESDNVHMEGNKVVTEYFEIEFEVTETGEVLYVD